MKTFDIEDLNIVYEDNQILVVVKPQNLPVCEDETGDPDLLNLLKQYIVKKYDKPGDAFLGLVHRLDRPTGGVMVFARNSKSAARLAECMKEGELEKKYLAVTVGIPKQSRNVLKNALYKDTSKNEVYCVPLATEGAKLAILEYHTIAEKSGHALVDIKLVTGRSHQARVQMANIGTPLFGDQKYGKGKSPAAANLALWAYELRFPHPVTKDIMVFRVLPPTDEIPWKAFDILNLLAIIK